MQTSGNDILFSPDALGEDFYEFVSANAAADCVALRLRLAGRPLPFPAEAALTQIECRRVARRRLPVALACPRFLFPHRLSAEQCSSEASAVAKWDFVERIAGSLAGKRVLDMTAGLGVDAFEAARRGAEVTACEMNPQGAAVLDWNARALGLGGVTAVCADSCSWLRDSDWHGELIFLDPARRDCSSRRTYALSDCTPDFPALLPLLRERARMVVAKCSPMLDVRQTLREVPEASALRIVSVRGECKELLLVVEADAEKKGCQLSSVDVAADGTVCEFFAAEPEVGVQPARFASDDDFVSAAWLFEPDAGVMKIAAWRRLTEDFPGLVKVAPNTHLFLARDEAGEAAAGRFPGRAHRVAALLGADGLKGCKGRRMNVVARNYPRTPEELRRKYRLADGGGDFLYAMRDASGRARHIFCQSSS